MSDYLDRTDSFIRALNVEAYRVGGSVRDEILGRRVKDADYVVRGSSLADLGRALQNACIDHNLSKRGNVTPLKLRDGRQAGWRVAVKGLGLIEVVLPRTEVSTGPGHRDFKIVLDPDLPLAEDAKRRDFTFNALYLDIMDRSTDKSHGTLLDPTERGLHDLTHRTINVTHADSFRDDPLRTLRALRFISTLGYDLGPETRALMALHADAVTGLSAKGYASGTVLDELSKLLMGQDPAKALRVARDTGVLAVAFPELAPMLGFDQGSRYHDMTTDEHVFTALETAARVDAPLRVRMALLFHDAGKPESAWVGKDGRKHYYEPSDKVWAEVKHLNTHLVDDVPVWIKPQDHEVVGARIWREAAARLNAPRDLTGDVERLIRNHMVPCMKADPVKARRERVRLGDDLLRDLYLMRMCDLSGKGDKNVKFLANIAAMEGHRRNAQADKVPAHPGDLRITGHDLLSMGITGRNVGRVLGAVLDEVVVDPSEQKLTREWQMKAAERLA